MKKMNIRFFAIVCLFVALFSTINALKEYPNLCDSSIEGTCTLVQFSGPQIVWYCVMGEPGSVCSR